MCPWLHALSTALGLQSQSHLIQNKDNPGHAHAMHEPPGAYRSHTGTLCLDTHILLLGMDTDTLTSGPPTPLGHGWTPSDLLLLPRAPAMTHSHHASLLCFIVAARPMWWLVFSEALALQLKVIYWHIKLSQVIQVIVQLLFFVKAASPERPALDGWGSV